MPDQISQTTVFFDGACPLCRAEIGVYDKADTSGALSLVDVSDLDTALPSSLDPKSAKARFHVMASDGRLLSGAAAFVEVWQHLPGWRWAAKVASIPGVTPLLELGYRFFLLMRPAFVRAFVFLRRRRSAPQD